MTARILRKGIIDRFGSGRSLSGRMAAAGNGAATVLGCKEDKEATTGPTMDDHT